MSYSLGLLAIGKQLSAYIFHEKAKIGILVRWQKLLLVTLSVIFHACISSKSQMSIWRQYKDVQVLMFVWGLLQPSNTVSRCVFITPKWLQWNRRKKIPKPLFLFPIYLNWIKQKSKLTNWEQGFDASEQLQALTYIFIQENNQMSQPGVIGITF